MSKGDYEKMMEEKRQRRLQALQDAEDKRKGANPEAVNQFISTASYGDSNAAVPPKKDRRKKASEDKGKAFTFYMQEMYSEALNRRLDEFSRSESVSRSDLLKIGINLVSDMPIEELKAAVAALNNTTKNKEVK